MNNQNNEQDSSLPQNTPELSLYKKTEFVFGPNGKFAEHIQGYETRQQQLQMAKSIAEAFEDEFKIIIEAGTGTGKTFSYLVPAILSGQRTIISTATKNLQEQIFKKDLPLLRKVLDLEFDAVYLKGKRNYLCLWQWQNFKSLTVFESEKKFLRIITDWAKITKTGDRAELTSLPDYFKTWNDLSISGDACLGKKCTHYQNCFVKKALKKAFNADIIIINHHLFFANLAIGGGLLPVYHAAIFDEAHNLEDIAANFFGTSISNMRIKTLIGDVTRYLEREDEVGKHLKQAIKSLKEKANAFFRSFKKRMKNRTRTTIKKIFKQEDIHLLEQNVLNLKSALKRFNIVLAANYSTSEGTNRFVLRGEKLSAELETTLRHILPNHAYIAEIRREKLFLIDHPIDLQAIFRRLLYSTCPVHIYTSATLSTDNGFEFFRRQMGMPEETKELQLKPVFNYINQAILYVPPTTPHPNDDRFISEIAKMILQLIQISEGKAFLLFTSYRNMKAVYKILAPKITQTTLIQGEMGRNTLLERFRKDIHSVLFATSSFWEGVDVQGEALSLVVIDKLPFANHLDPITQAKMSFLRAKGHDPFREFQIPLASISLKQGFGRLIRHKKDIGIVAILDARIVNKPYGKRFIQALPRARRTQNIEIVKRWWKAKNEPQTNK